MYSQNEEEKFIVDYFSTAAPGRFLEVGAYHPKIFSNTRALVELGWSGTCVEPAPVNFAAFLTEYRDNSNITLVNSVVGDSSRLVEFYDSGGDALSSVVPAHVSRWSAAGVKFRKYLTKMITWDELLEATGDDYLMLSLDAEGVSFDLFMMLPFARFSQLKLVVIEHDYHSDEIMNVLRPLGFEQLMLNGENLIAARP